MALSRFQKFIEKRWYSKPGALHLLRPLEGLFTFAASIKKANANKIPASLPVPVLIVGNITVGGTGKTPTIICLLKFLLRQGFKPGVISRGYGRTSRDPLSVGDASSAYEVGDEALLVYRETSCPVVLHSKRLNAAKFLLNHHPECDLLIADDGLQHYALPRDLELVMVDGLRLFGNGHALPLGPLREKPARLHSVDWVLVNMRQHANKKAIANTLKGIDWHSCELKPACLRNIVTHKRQEIRAFQAHYENHTIHAITAIAYPDDFYASLKKLGINSKTESFPDHFQWKVEQIEKFSTNTLICTSKDAVKLQQLVTANPHLDAAHWYSLETEMQIPETLKVEICTRIQKCMQEKRQHKST